MEDLFCQEKKIFFPGGRGKCWIRKCAQNGKPVLKNLFWWESERAKQERREKGEKKKVLFSEHAFWFRKMEYGETGSTPKPLDFVQICWKRTENSSLLSS
ncbi:MAG: hypothetical protein GY765_11630 [bacterium]|nr:hypothetical protein [bacterium]